MRRLLPIGLLLGCLTGGLRAQQAIPMDCGQPAVPVNLSSSTVRANLTFAGDQGEAVYLRFLFKNVAPGFATPDVKVVDAFGRVITPRPPTTSASTGGTSSTDTPVDLAGQGFEVDLPAKSQYTVQITNRSTDSSATVLVTMARLNRPCGDGKTLTCGRATSAEILTPLSPADTDHWGQMDTY